MLKILLNKLYKFKIILLLMLLGFTGSLCGCTKLELSGNQIDFERAESILEGDDASEVVSLMGSPTYVTKYGDLQYIYVREKLRHKPIFNPELENLDIVVVSFDEHNMVKNVQLRSELEPNDNIDILHDRVTIKGNTVNPFKQIIGNIGKYNTDHKAPGM